MEQKEEEEEVEVEVEEDETSHKEEQQHSMEHKKKHKKGKKKKKKKQKEMKEEEEEELFDVRATLDKKSLTLLDELHTEISKLDLNPTLKKWCDDQCLSGYLEARNWDLHKATVMLKESIKWREEMKPDEITEEDVAGPLGLGTMYPHGHDKEGRPVIYVKPGAYNPYSAEERVKYLIFVMERAIKQMDKKKGTRKLCWIMDFSDYGKRAKSPEGKKVAQNSLHVLQNHYPERLGACFIINAPWYFSMLYTILSPFIDSVTRKKIHWVSGDVQGIHQQLTKAISEEELEDQYGGKLPTLRADQEGIEERITNPKSEM